MDWNLELEGARAAAIALAVISGTLFLLLLTLWIRQSRRGGLTASTAEAAELHAAMVRLQAELPELLRSMTTRLDAKMRALRELIHEAGSAAEELRRRKTAAATPAALHAAKPIIPAQVSRLEGTPAGVPGSPPASPPRATEHRLAEPVAADPAELRAERYAHVYSLADAGLDSAEISAETGMHRGEVELVLSLRRKRVRLDRGSRLESTHAPSSPEEATA